MVERYNSLIMKINNNDNNDNDDNNDNNDNTDNDDNNDNKQCFVLVGSSYHNRTKLNWGPFDKWNICHISCLVR